MERRHSDNQRTYHTAFASLSRSKPLVQPGERRERKIFYNSKRN